MQREGAANCSHVLKLMDGASHFIANQFTAITTPNTMKYVMVLVKFVLMQLHISIQGRSLVLSTFC